MKGLSHSTIRWIRTHRKTVTIGSIIVGVLILAGGYGIWSKYSWDAYETNHLQWRNDTRRGVEVALALPSASSQERRDKLTKLTEVSNTIEDSKKSLCTVGGLVAWQRAFDALRLREVECRKGVETLSEYGSHLRAITTYLGDDQALAGVFLKAPTYKNEVEDKKWADQAKIWQDMAEETDALSVGSDFATIKQKSYVATKAIGTAWQEVIAAHKAKDKSRYLKAQSQLAKSYASLDEIATASSETLRKLLKQLPTL